MTNKLFALFGIITVISLSTNIARAGEQRLHSNSKPGLKCLVITERNVIRDRLNYPGAYEEGYQQGTEARTKGASFQSPTSEGELARGYTDAYQLKSYRSQITTVPTVNNVNCGCGIRILKNVLFKTETEATCKSERTKIQSTMSTMYHPNAYDDGYREGIAVKARRETYQARNTGGEFARGFETGYFGRKNTGQRYTEVSIDDYKCKCSLVLDNELREESE